MANKNTKQARKTGFANGLIKNQTAGEGKNKNEITRHQEPIFKGQICATHFGAPLNKHKNKKIYPSNRRQQERDALITY